MRSFTIFLICTLVVSVLSGCGGGVTAPPNDNPTTTPHEVLAPTETEIALPTDDTQDPVNDAYMGKLFWAVALYDDDSLLLDAPDYDIHVLSGADKLLEDGGKLPGDGKKPEGYQFAQESSGKLMHLRRVQNPSMGIEMLALYTDFSLMLQMFSPNVRVCLVDYQTARDLCLQDGEACAGIIINPGRDNTIIWSEQLVAAP